MTATNDLDRLQTLLGDACGSLQASFFNVSQLLEVPAASAQPETEHLHAARKHLGSAVTALQFPDMASQLFEHLRRVCATVPIALRATPSPTMKTASRRSKRPLRPNPVTQAEMDTGFVELF